MSAPEPAQINHLCVVFFHDFPLELFSLVLDRAAECADGILAVCYQDTRPDMIDLAWRHSAVCDLWRDRMPFHPQTLKNRTVDYINIQGYEPATLMMLAQDQIAPKPAHFLREREAFIGSPHGDMRFWNLNTWDSVDQVTVPMSRLLRPHTTIVKWRADLCWRPPAWYGAPANGGSVYVCPYPIRHMVFQTQALRERKADYYYKPVREMLQRDTMPVVPYDPDRTWDQWMAM